jgi:hypothetical protein
MTALKSCGAIDDFVSACPAEFGKTGFSDARFFRPWWQYDLRVKGGIHIPAMVSQTFVKKMTSVNF